MEIFIRVIMFLYFSVFFYYLYFHRIFKRRLEKVYPELGLGTSLYPDISFATDLKLTRFLLYREYRTLDNPHFVSFCGRFRALVIACYLMSGVAIATLTVFFIIHGKNS
jgi:hypothetical protein